MTNVGLTKEQIMALLLEGIVPNEPINADKLCEAIANAIVKNNEEIQKNAPKTVAEGFMNDMRKRGKRF